jgi:hypothetical protein
MKRFFLVPLVAVTLLQLAGIAASSTQKKTTRASKKLPYKAKVPGVDPTMGDNVDGDDPSPAVSSSSTPPTGASSVWSTSGWP